VKKVNKIKSFGCINGDFWEEYMFTPLNDISNTIFRHNQLIDITERHEDIDWALRDE